MTRAFLVKGVGVGWTLHSINKDEIRKVLSKPWTVDRQTFSDRIWSNKQSLINTVNTELTQMIMRGAAPDNAIKAISERFKVSKSQAGRLVMTESAAFANEARKDCFKELDVEEYVIVETLDGKTCDHVMEYEHGNDAQRMKLANSVEDVHFSLESKQLTELRRENERKLAEATEADAQNENERGLIKSYKKQYNKVLDIAVQLDTAKQELSKAESDGATNDVTKAKNRVALLNRQYAREHRKLNSYKETKALQNVLSRVNERTPAKDSTHIDNRSFSNVGDRKGGFTLEEKEILTLRADGKSLIEIADRMHCSVETVNRRIRCIKIKIADIVKG